MDKNKIIIINGILASIEDRKEFQRQFDNDKIIIKSVRKIGNVQYIDTI